MSFGVSVVYRSLRETTYATYWRSVLVMTLQVVIGISILSAAIGVFVQLAIPLINPP